MNKRRLKRLEMNTPVEVIADVLQASRDADLFDVGDILVPEQCFEFWMDGKHYHVTVEEVK